MQATTLTEESFEHGISLLISQDADLERSLLKWGTPPFWVDPPGFPSIVLGILSQQVSLESARAAFTKLEKIILSVHPEGFMTLSDETLRAIGFSRQKTSYVRGVAHEILTGELDLDELQRMDDDQARNRLMKIKGIGAWTADTYLVFALRRPDAWPTGDLALIKAMQEIKGMQNSPSREEADRLAEQWKPWRAVAARILWHHYLRERGRSL